MQGKREVILNVILILVAAVFLFATVIFNFDINQKNRISGFQIGGGGEEENGSQFINPNGSVFCDEKTRTGPCFCGNIDAVPCDAINPPKEVVDELKKVSKELQENALYSKDIENLTKNKQFKEEDLIRQRLKIEIILSKSFDSYNKSKELSEKYSSSELNYLFESIVENIDIINNIYRSLNSRTKEKIEERQKIQIKEAEWTIKHEELVDNSVSLLIENKIGIDKQYYEERYNQFLSKYVNDSLIKQCISETKECSNYENCPSYIYLCITSKNEEDSLCTAFLDKCMIQKETQEPQIQIINNTNNNQSSNSSGTNKSTNQTRGQTGGIGSVGGIGAIGGVGGNGNNTSCVGSSCEDLPACTAPDYLIASKKEFIDLGGYGKNSVTGEVCYVGKRTIYTRASRLIYTNNSENNNSNSGTNKTEKDSLSNLERNVRVIHFKNVNGEKNYEAAIFSKDENNQVNIKFVSAVNYNRLDAKINDAVNKILYKKLNVEEVHLSPISQQESEDLINQKSNVPWILWGMIILLFLVFFFIYRFN
jgi:hypothetical protein